MKKLIIILVIIAACSSVSAQSNSGIIKQIGNCNDIEILQSGIMNYCSAFQQGNENYFLSEQNGIGNHINYSDFDSSEENQLNKSVIIQKNPIFIL